ncbi:hypothetical protein [Flavobacterium gyeonganense]|uniref:O-antigen ligase-like membrane protein n=1 Tax=Flavobacterium gyeonganense TaxID=1310418 RepID=A0ABV5HGB4_9FLAO|nr:hypothetical protein [Flavobacterium gyeonganense]
MTKKEIFTYLGISLSLIGVPLGMYFNYLFPFIKWSPVFMFLSVALILSYKNLFAGRLPSFNKWFTIIIGYQLLMLLYGLFSVRMNSQYLSFHIYIILLVLALASNKNNATYDKIILFTFYISALCTFLGAYFIWKGLVTGEEAWQLRQDQQDYALEAFTIANGAIINYACVLCLRFKNKFIKIFLSIVFALDIYVLFMSTKRTPVFVAIIIAISYLYKTGSVNKTLVLQYFKTLLLTLIAFIAAYINIEDLQKIIDKFTYEFYSGVFNIFGNTEVRDSSGSAIARYTAREWAYNYINNNFDFFNYILGAGYMTRWIDNPLLQSFLDMGLIGLFMYIMLILIFPIKSYFSIANILALFAFLLCVYNIMVSISSGNPYIYMKHIPIVFLAFTMNLKKKKYITTGTINN